MDFVSVAEIVAKIREEKALNAKLKQQIKQAVKKSNTSTKEYTITLFVKNTDKQGNESITVGEIENYTRKEKESPSGIKYFEVVKEMEPAVFSADDYGAAQRKADRVLLFRHDAVYCSIENMTGKKIITNIPRGDAIARMLRSKKGSVCRERGKSTKTLKWIGKAKNDRSIGPWSIR
jgi:hypothetical protein